jgi:hypothetical protein
MHIALHVGFSSYKTPFGCLRVNSGYLHIYVVLHTLECRLVTSYC